MNMGSGSGQLTVPPGFRFHPTDEELLYYYLRKKVSYEAIDLDVIREIDLNKLEPWDLKEKCRIGSGPQNEWYFFSHKDKKYPTGTRTNRATAAGFWKATGRDKAIHLSDSKKIGMRKTLVFYTGRAPHGQKTDWIMHEYRLDDNDNSDQIQEDGWVVCRVFKKKSHNRGGNNIFQQDIITNNNNNNHNNHQHQHDMNNNNNIMSYGGHMKASGSTSAPLILDHHHHHHHHHQQAVYDYNTHAFDPSMHLPQLFNPDDAVAVVVPPSSAIDLDCSHSLLSLTSAGAGGFDHPQQRPFNAGDWTFLDKLLNNSTNGNANNNHGNLIHHQHQHHHPQQAAKCHPSSSSDHRVAAAAASTQRLFPFHQYLGCDTDLLKFTK